MAEWSKAIDSSSIIFGCAGSNPAESNIILLTANIPNCYFRQTNSEGCKKRKTNNGVMAEWSKAIDLSSIIFGCAGSNPAGTTLPILVKPSKAS